ncbi:GntR family transcriptional regulator [Streptomyces sp. TRM 70361]|uniref:GntR family transcriptional regulator n=1 Tax=Streptomyces sp. TRM 70361 TaxID=3116553 RepID=UPI002E7AF1BE|nr:GntR family transcriptional regulator [Streptomyces sp. TRM 70361]MEE1942327.1 GntR family transcriptional regulator [Streptomyces sp. TRM 70361]
MVEIPDGYGPDDEIDHEAPEPVYLQLAAVLVARIRRGDYPPRRAVPGVDRLVQEFGIARGTARKTLVLLAEKGIVQTVVGKGSFVTEQPSPETGSGGDRE